MSRREAGSLGRPRELQASGAPIADHDLWIAALALEHGHPVVSRNERHFARVPGLAVRSY